MEKKRGKKAWKSCGTVRKYRSNSSREFHRKKNEKVLRNSTEISWPGTEYTIEMIVPEGCLTRFVTS